jgi:hypothetical protein
MMKKFLNIACRCGARCGGRRSAKSAGSSHGEGPLIVGIAAEDNGSSPTEKRQAVTYDFAQKLKYCGIKETPASISIASAFASLIMLCAAPALALSPVTFVSGKGTDTGTCTLSCSTPAGR